jgi:hypothetical protein
MLRQTASPSWCRALIWSPWPDFCFLSDSCGFLAVGRPLWRDDGSVIYCTIASGPCQSSLSWAEGPQNSRPYFTVSSETPPTWRARSPYLYLPGTGWPSYIPRHWVPLPSPLTTRRDYGGGILTRLHTGVTICETSSVTNDSNSYSSCYKGCLVTWTILHQTSAELKPLISSVSGFAFPDVANICAFIFY